MSVETDDAVPLIRAQRLDGNTLRVVCPYCRDRKGKPRIHIHGAGGQPGPWRRLAHCVTGDLPPKLRELRRSGGSLCYKIVEHPVPRVIKRPAPVAAGASDDRRRRFLALRRDLN